MKVLDIYGKVKNRTLTCSDVAELLADQPTASGMSHAHMHTVDGFRCDPSLIIQNHTTGSVSDNRDAKKRAWDMDDAHLYPPTATKLPPFDPSKMTAMGKAPVYIDPARQAADDKYLIRTNLPEAAEVPEVRQKLYFVKRMPATGKGAPVDVPIGSPTDAPIPMGDTDLYVMDKGTGHRKVFTSNLGPVLTAKVPRKPPTSAHTMFEDSESMVMHVAAALLSVAGLEVLRTLKKRGPGPLTVGVFSKTAVRAVSAKFSAVASTTGATVDPNRMIHRVADSNPDRSPTGTFTKAKIAFDHVALVLGASATFDLNVVSAFPTDVLTGASIGCPSTADQDVAEHTFGVHTIVPVTNPLPTLTW